MASSKSVPTKRKFDQVDDETQFLSNKKIKAEENRHEEGNNLFSVLPSEIVHFILSFFTSDTQRRHIRLVCQQWFDYINYNEFKIGLLLTSEVEQFSRCFGRYQKPIALKFMKVGCLSKFNDKKDKNENIMRSNQMFHSMLSSLTQLTALDLQLKDFEIPQELVNLQALTVISPIHGDTLLRLTNLRRLKTASQLTKIPTTLESLDLQNNAYIKIASPRSYSRLTELIVSTKTRCEIPKTLTKLRKLGVFESKSSNRGPQMNLMTFPYLEEFITNRPERSFLPDPSISGKLPTHYSSTLTKLHQLSGSIVEINQNLRQLKDLQCSGVQLDNNLQLHALEDCVVSINNETILEHLDSQKITKLKLRVVPQNYHIWSNFTNLIDLDITSGDATIDISPYLVPLTHLTQLRLKCTIYPHQWMTQLPSLVNLTLLEDDNSKSSTLKSINFGTMHQLTSLELSGNYYSSISIINLTNLLHVRIFNPWAPNPIKIYGLSTATNLTSLVVGRLSIHGNSSIGESSAKDLALLTNLRMLSLDRSDNADIINIESLSTLQHLTYLDALTWGGSVWYLTRLSRLQCVQIATYDHAVDRTEIFKGLPLCHQFEVTVHFF